MSVSAYLHYNITNMEKRIQENPDNVPREVMVLIAKDKVRSEEGEYGLTLFRELDAHSSVHKTSVEVRQMTPEIDRNEYVPGLKCTLTVDKTTNLPRLKAFLQVYDLYYSSVYNK